MHRVHQRSHLLECWQLYCLAQWPPSHTVPRMQFARLRFFAHKPMCRFPAKVQDYPTRDALPVFAIERDEWSRRVLHVLLPLLLQPVHQNFPVTIRPTKWSRALRCPVGFAVLGAMGSTYVHDKSLRRLARWTRQTQTR